MVVAMDEDHRISRMRRISSFDRSLRFLAAGTFVVIVALVSSVSAQRRGRGSEVMTALVEIAGMERVQARNATTSVRARLESIVRSQAPSSQPDGLQRAVLFRRLESSGVSGYVAQLEWFETRLGRGLTPEVVRVVFAPEGVPMERRVDECTTLFPEWRIAFGEAFISASTGERVGPEYREADDGSELRRALMSNGITTQQARRIAETLSTTMPTIPDVQMDGSLRSATVSGLFRACPAGSRTAIERIRVWQDGATVDQARCVAAQFAEAARAPGGSIEGAIMAARDALGLDASDARAFIEWGGREAP